MASAAKNRKAPAQAKSAVDASAGATELLAYYKQRTGTAQPLVSKYLNCCLSAMKPGFYASRRVRGRTAELAGKS